MRDDIKKCRSFKKTSEITAFWNQSIEYYIDISIRDGSFSREQDFFFNEDISVSLKWCYFVICPPLLGVTPASAVYERYRLTALAVDNEAGPHKNYTVVFIGAESGVVLKVLAKTPSVSLDDSLLLEEIDVFNRAK